MHVLFVHQNYPAQFGHIAAFLTARHGWRCTFISEREPGFDQGIEKIQYLKRGGATRENSFHTRGFENAVAHAQAVYTALRDRPDIQPDLIVGHSGFGSTIFLPQLTAAPIISYFEYFYRPTHSDMDFRPDVPPSEKKLLRSRVRNAMILLDLDACAAGYAPTLYQKSVFPAAYQHKLRAIFDGIDTQVFRPIPNPPRAWAGRNVPPGTRVVTYCARGFEKMRGFDQFLRAAKIIYSRRPDVLFLVAGTDQICYGADQEQLGTAPSLRHLLFEKEQYDASKFIFTGWLSGPDLAAMLSLGDAHIYYTVPFVLSWSMMNALGCGSIVCASNTDPVREMITPGQNGFLADFFEPEAMAVQVLEILKDPPAFANIRQNATEFIHRRYSLHAVLPQILDLYEATVRHRPPSPPPATGGGAVIQEIPIRPMLG